MLLIVKGLIPSAPKLSGLVEGCFIGCFGFIPYQDGRRRKVLLLKKKKNPHPRTC